MKKGDLILVYGTLLKGERAEDLMTSGCAFVSSDRVNGEMFSLGGFPGLKANSVDAFDNGASAVVGEVYRIRDENVIPRLDGYEGYPHLYNRIQTKTERGHTVWVYTYNGQPDVSRLIPGGDWRERIIQQVAA